jgi:hypothetical protein
MLSKSNKKLYFVILALMTSLNFTGCLDDELDDSSSDTTDSTSSTIDTSSTATEEGNLTDIIASIEEGTELTENEVASLKFMREEEKLAHDVYTKLYEIYTQDVFTNISDSEQKHTDAVGELLKAYGIEDPYTDDTGVFLNEELQTIYDNLIAQGDDNLVEALKVGATVEELDIRDIQNEIDTKITQTQIKTIYESLMKGSRNHLRSFIKNLNNQDSTIIFEPQYITQEKFDEIINSDMETDQ